MPWTPTEQYPSDDEDETRTLPARSPVPAATPPESEDEDEDDGDEFDDAVEMDEEGYWFATSREQEHYPEHMREKRGECQEELLRKEQLRHEHDRANPKDAAIAKKVRQRMKKKQRKAEKKGNKA